MGHKTAVTAHSPVNGQGILRIKTGPVGVNLQTLVGTARKEAHCFLLDLPLEAAADGPPATPGESVQIVEPTQRKLAQKQGERNVGLV